MSALVQSHKSLDVKKQPSLSSQKPDLQAHRRHTVRKEDVHKKREENRFLSWLEQGHDESGELLYRAKVRILPDHDYFFEHDRRHIPGLYIIEAGRQLGLAVPHLFLNVASDQAFILDGCDMTFAGFANLQDDLLIEATIFNRVDRKGKLQALSFDGTFYQNDQALVRYQSHIRFINERLLSRYEKQISSS